VHDSDQPVGKPRSRHFHGSAGIAVCDEHDRSVNAADSLLDVGRVRPDAQVRRRLGGAIAQTGQGRSGGMMARGGEKRNHPLPAHGTLDGLRANIEAVRVEARQVRAFGRMLREDFLAGAPTFADRLHIGVLVWRFLYDWAKQREAWANFALDWIDGWDDVTSTADRLASARLWFERALSEDDVSEGDRSVS
jgi:hypothetical protein